MADAKGPEIGEITWTDLTVPEAGPVRAFYEAVVGWTSTSVDMGGYEDFCMTAPRSGRTVAGICHARGPNEGLPAQWLLYLNVADLEASMAVCAAKGGELLGGIRAMPGIGRMCVIRDPAGAVSALFQGDQ